MGTNKFGFKLEVGKLYADRQGLLHEVLRVEKDRHGNERFVSQCYWGEWTFAADGQVYDGRMHRRDLIREVGPYAECDRDAKYWTEDSNRFSPTTKVVYGGDSFLVNGPVRLNLDVSPDGENAYMEVFVWQGDGFSYLGSEPVSTPCSSYEDKTQLLKKAMEQVFSSIARNKERPRLTHVARSRLRAV